MTRIFALLLVVVSGVACGGKGGGVANSPEDREAAGRSVAALVAGDLAAARDASGVVLATQPRNSVAAATHGLSTWVLAGEELFVELMAVITAAEPVRQFNHERTRKALEATLARLMEARADFAIAARDPELVLSVCLACWERDWNHSGEIDNGDRSLLAIERDINGQRLADGDPRRKPTYRLDVGDAHWAHAMVSFQAAALEIVLAYDGRQLDKLFGRMPTSIELPLLDKSRIARARRLILEGLDSSDAAREAYLAETDDNVEWVPSPTQKNHPVPLEVDAALYETWKGVIGDVRELVSGKTGISMGELSMLERELRGMSRPTGYLDVGMMLREPRSITISVAELARTIETQEAAGQVDSDVVLGQLFGSYYKKTMKASPLTRRLLDLTATLKAGGADFDRKLMYLLWLN